MSDLSSLRRRGWVQALLMLGVGFLLDRGFDHRIAAVVVWMLAALIALGSLCVPVILKCFDRFGAWLAHAVGVSLTWLTLVPLYYLVFTPIRVGGLLRGRDPLRRRWEPAAKSYWDDRRPIADARHFERTY